MLAQGFEDRLARADVDRGPGACEPYAERPILGNGERPCVREALDMHRRGRPVSGHVAHRLQHRPRPAAIDVQRAGSLEERPQVERARGIAAVVVDRHVTGERRCGKLVAKRRFLRRARQVMQLEPAPVAQRQVPHHRHDRRDADAAGDEQEFLRLLGQLEIVVRRGARQHCAFAAGIDEAGRAAAARRLALDGDHVAMAFAAIVRQRILAQQPVRRLHGDVRARRERRQLLPSTRDELERVNAHRGWHGARDRQRYQRWRSLAHGSAIGSGNRSVMARLPDSGERPFASG